MAGSPWPGLGYAFNSYDLSEIGRENVFKQRLIDFLSLTKCRP